MNTNPEYSKALNDLLATYQLHYQNLRSLHWNIKGENFFELHVKYEEWYNRTLIIVDEIAERILTLGMQPLSTFTEYINNSKISENKIIHVGSEGVTYILESYKKLLQMERNLMELSAAQNDEGTNSFMSDLIREKEKESWMLSAWLNK